MIVKLNTEFEGTRSMQSDRHRRRNLGIYENNFY